VPLDRGLEVVTLSPLSHRNTANEGERADSETVDCSARSVFSAAATPMADTGMADIGVLQQKYKQIFELADGRLDEAIRRSERATKWSPRHT
jgi:hypothetical protein